MTTADSNASGPQHPPASGLGGHFDALFRTSSDCLFLVEPGTGGELIYVAINGSAQKLLPVPWHEAKGRTPGSVLGGEAGATLSTRLAEVFNTGNPLICQHVFTTEAGETVFDSVYTPVLDIGGTITGVLGSARDLTLQRRLGVALAEIQRDRALVEMARTFAKDASILVGHLIDQIHFLRHDLSDSIRQQVIAEIFKNAALVDTLFDRFREPVSAAELYLQTTDLRPILRRVQTTIQKLTDRPFQVSFIIDDALKKVLIDAASFELALFDLVVVAAGLSEGERRNVVRLDATNLPHVANDEEGAQRARVAITLTFASIQDHTSSEGLRNESLHVHANSLAIELASAIMERMGGKISRPILPSRDQTLTLELPCADASDRGGVGTALAEDWSWAFKDI